MQWILLQDATSIPMLKPFYTKLCFQTIPVFHLSPVKSRFSCLPVHQWILPPVTQPWTDVS